MQTGTKLRRAGLSALHISGVDRVFQQVDGALGLILAVRHVSPHTVRGHDPLATVTITPRFLERTLVMLRRRGFDLVSMDEVPARVRRADRTRRFAALTFDEPTHDFVAHALPVLRAHDAPGALYVTPGLIDGTALSWPHAVAALLHARDRILFPGPTGPIELDCRSSRARRAAFRAIARVLTQHMEPAQIAQRVREVCWLYKVDADAPTRERYLGWDELRTLSATEGVVLGSQTLHRYVLASLPAKAARNETVEGARVMEAALGARPTHFAYPNGERVDAGPREFGIAKRARSRTAVTARPGLIYAAHAAHLHALPRLVLHGEMQHLRHLCPRTSGLPTRLANWGRRLDLR